MRALLSLFLLLLLAPAAHAAWTLTIDAPPAWASGVPFEVEACVRGGGNASVQIKVDLTLEGARVGRAEGVGAGRYDAGGALDARGCRVVTVEPEDVAGDARLVVKARPETGGAARAEAEARVGLARVPVAAQDGALVPVFEGAAPRLRVVEAWGAPFAGVVLANEGDAPARLALHALEGVALPANATLAPGERAFIGERAPPDASLRHVAAALPTPRGNVTLTAARATLSWLDVGKLAPGFVADAHGARRMGAWNATPPLVATGWGGVTVLALPDAGARAVVDLIDAARDDVVGELFTLTSPEVADALLRALDRGVRVRLLLEGAPAGGVPQEEERIVAAISARGGEVAFMASAPEFPTRYRTMHAKTLVVDGARALVSTDNLVPTSFPAHPTRGGAGTRGFALIVDDATLAAWLADLVARDLAPWPDARRADADALPPPAPLPPAPMAEGVEGAALAHDGAWRAQTVSSPGGDAALVDAMANATRAIDVAMLLVDARYGADENPLLEALVAAARRGVHVRLLMDGHVGDARNEQVARRLVALATREALPLEARVDDAPRTLHAKMVLIDGERAYVGSMNWGRASARDNREVGLLLDAPEVAAWLGAWFEKDWAAEAALPPEKNGVPGASVALGLLAMAASAAVHRRVEVRKLADEEVHLVVDAAGFDGEHGRVVDGEHVVAGLLDHELERVAAAHLLGADDVAHEALAVGGEQRPAQRVEGDELVEREGQHRRVGAGDAERVVVLRRGGVHRARLLHLDLRANRPRGAHPGTHVGELEVHLEALHHDERVVAGVHEGHRLALFRDGHDDPREHAFRGAEGFREEDVLGGRDRFEGGVLAGKLHGAVGVRDPVGDGLAEVGALDRFVERADLSTRGRGEGTHLGVVLRHVGVDPEGRAAVSAVRVGEEGLGDVGAFEGGEAHEVRAGAPGVRGVVREVSVAHGGGFAFVLGERRERFDAAGEARRGEKDRDGGDKPPFHGPPSARNGS